MTHKPPGQWICILVHYYNSPDADPGQGHEVKEEVHGEATEQANAVDVVEV